jgi:hypothetical protein
MWFLIAWILICPVSLAVSFWADAQKDAQKRGENGVQKDSH